MQSAVIMTETRAVPKGARTGAVISQCTALLSGLIWISLLVMAGVIAATLTGAGGFGPDVPVGWPNRLVMLAYCVWLITAARCVLRAQQ